MNEWFNIPDAPIATSGVAVSESCLFAGFLLGMDETNDATITVFDNASAASGTELVPTNKYDATALGLNGAMLAMPVLAKNGIYIEITCGGSCEVIPLYKKLSG